MQGQEEFKALRWAVNTTNWDPKDKEWDFLLGLLPESERTPVMRFKFMDDKKRAIVSRLLQRRCVEENIGILWEDIDIKRTKGRKPFLATKTNCTYAPNFNFNVSHEGDYVVLASEPMLVCGVDVAAPGQLRRGKMQTIAEIKQTFQSSFTQMEWHTIFEAGAEESDKLECFRCHWSLKEAFVKARGDGIAFELNRCEFEFDTPWPAQTARVSVDGVQLEHWLFSIQRLGGDHWVSVARGPPSDVIDANGEFKATFKKANMSASEITEQLNSPWPTFEMVGIGNLLSPSHVAEYDAIVASGGAPLGFDT